MPVFDMCVHIAALLRFIITIGALKARITITLVFKMSPKSIFLFINFTATLANITASLLWVDDTFLCVNCLTNSNIFPEGRILIPKCNYQQIEANNLSLIFLFKQKTKLLFASDEIEYYLLKTNFFSFTILYERNKFQLSILIKFTNSLKNSPNFKYKNALVFFKKKNISQSSL